MSKSNLDDVKQFHSKFNVPTRATPGFLDKDVMEYRIKFIQEELDELQTATDDGNLEKAVDALVDIVWVTLGLSDKMAVPWDECWSEVRRANMEKVLATEPHPTRGPLETIKKPDGWVEPNHSPILEKYRGADDPA